MRQSGAYLAQHELEPKRQGKSTVEDQEFDVMNFGGCYLGKHLKVIEGYATKGRGAGSPQGRGSSGP